MLFSLFIIWGIYPFLKRPLFETRAMYGIGIAIALFAFWISNEKRNYIPKLFVFLLFWGFFTFSLTYGNCLSEQNRYNDFIIQSAIDILQEMDIMNNYNKKAIYVTGNAGYSPVIDNYPFRYEHLIKRLIKQTFNGEKAWGDTYFINYFKIKRIYSIKDYELIPKDIKLTKETLYFDFYTYDDDFILINIK